MALPQYNNQSLIENIKRRCSVPTSQLTYDNEDFVLIANDELQDVVVPMIMSTREEYFVEFIEAAAPSDGVIDIPSVAIGAKLRSVCYVQQSSPLLLVNLPRYNLDVVAGVGWANNTSIAGFYVQGNKLYLWPNTNVPQNTLIRMYYYRRSLVLAQPTMYGQVTSVDTLTNTIIVNRVPTTWATGTRLNAVSSLPSFKTTNELCIIDTVSAPSIILDNVDGIEVGDYISDEGYSAIAQVPVEAHAYLAQLAAVKCLEGLGDGPGMERAQAKLSELEKGLMTVTTQRVDGSFKKIVNPSGGLRIGAGLGRWGRGSSGGAY